MSGDSGVTLAPMRSMDDFLMNSARFQFPNVNDVDRWSNRVVNNLLYYQTNYIILVCAIVAIIGVLNPQQLMIGVIVFAATIAAAMFAVQNEANMARLRHQRPLVFAAAVGGVVYVFLYCIGALLVLVFATCLPLSVVFVHSSLRLRNLKNKLSNKIEVLGIKKTPMGILLNELGLEMEKFLLST